MTATNVNRYECLTGSLAPLDTPNLFRLLRERPDSGAREELVHRFTPLARKLASRYMNPYEPFEDLMQVASIGLLGAIDRFDPERGVGFSSFAIPTILGELKRYFRSTGWSAHVPRGAQELAMRVEQASRAYQASNGRPPRVTELEEILGLSTEDVLIGLEAGSAHYAVSLDAPVAASGPEAEPEPLSSTIGTTDERIGLIETSLSVSAAMKRLPRLERQALTLRLTKDLKQTEIAERLGCSQMQVSRLLRRAASTVRDLTQAQPRV
ncbi:MAG TPA: sigma-70 family RNA polymerase sigma factor [Solirubrobacteraceae bacterium]